MPVNYVTPAPDQLFPVAGVRLGVAEAGIRKANRRDLTLMTLDAGCTVAGVFTENRFCAAPVQVCRRHLGVSGEMRALVINTGIANAGTGEPGLKASEASCVAVAQTLGILQNFDLAAYPHLPKTSVKTTSAADYAVLLPGAAA